MAIGPGFVPAQLPTGQKYFELPFNELLAGLSAKQKQFDEVDDTKNKIFDDLLKVKPFYESDKQYVQQVQNKLSTNVDNIINKYQGDLTKARPEIQRLAREINQELTTGNLATVNYNTAEAAKILEDRAKAIAENKYGDFSKVLGLDPLFEQRQKMSLEEAIDPSTNQLKRLNFSSVHRQVNRPDEVKNIFDPLKADLTATDYFNPNTGYQNKESIKGIFRPRIYQTALQNLNALSPNLQSELDYQIKSGQLPLKEAAEEFIKAAYPKSNAKDLVSKFSPEELQHYAKAYEIGKLGENRTFTETQEGNSINVSWLNLQRELAKEEANKNLLGFDNPIQTTPEVKTEFDDIEFKDGKIKTTTLVPPSTNVATNTFVSYGAGSPNSAQKVEKPKSPEQIQKEENFIKTLRSQFPEFGKVITEEESKSKGLPAGSYIYNEEEVVKAWKQAKKNSTAYYNKFYRFPDNTDNTNVEKTMNQVLDTQPIYVEGSTRTDLSFDTALKELGVDKETFMKNKVFKGFNFSNENLPGIQYNIDVKGKTKTVIVGAHKAFRDEMELPRLTTQYIKEAVKTGEPQSFIFGGQTYEIFPELKKTSKGFTFEPIMQVNKQSVSPEIIYENAKSNALEKLNRKQ